MSTEPDERSYRVLARKYRPTVFAELIGQDALVRTLSNAIESGRLAHAYLLTGVRGVGKTTTARILARALNCIGPDGAGRETVTPCGVCEHCVAIAEDRHVDVLEMDAASRTGVEDIRELIDGVRYRPVTARYKIYIIDEIHMLSKQAFNALLKTLEEPPPHVKFIFATTEMRKVPVTVVSRCQRFDLRRVDAEKLVRHLEGIVAKEAVTVSPEALALIARAADGSVRDALSLLDQTIAHCGGKVDEPQVRDMLGLADRVQVFDLFEAVMSGDIKQALDELQRQYEAGVDPIVVLQDLLSLTHWLTRVKVVPAAADAITVPEAERVRGGELAKRLAMPVLARCWQMLLKGLGEARVAPNPLTAAEMVLVRLAYVADLPAPADLVKTIRDGGEAKPTQSSAPAASSVPQAVSTSVEAPPDVTTHEPVAPVAETPLPPQPMSFPEVIALAETKGEMVLVTNLRNHVRLVRFEPGRIEFQPTDAAPEKLANELGKKLYEWTGQRWMAIVAGEGGEPTLIEQAEEAQSRRIAEAKEDPLVKSVLETFPEAKVTNVRERPTGAEPPESSVEISAERTVERKESS